MQFSNRFSDIKNYFNHPDRDYIYAIFVSYFKGYTKYTCQFKNNNKWQGWIDIKWNLIENLYKLQKTSLKSKNKLSL